MGREKGEHSSRRSATDGVAIVNAEDDAAQAQVARVRAGQVLTFGHEHGDYRLREREPLGEKGSRVVVQRPNGGLLEAHPRAGR